MAKRKVNEVIASNSTRWVAVGTLPKVISFRSTSKRSPVESLHLRIKKLTPQVQSVSDIAVSRKTNEYLRKQLHKYVRAHYKYLSKQKQVTLVEFTMLDLSPVELEQADDFVLYRRMDP